MSHERGPFGTKTVGEPAPSPTAAAGGNAIADATGVDVQDLPITPEKIVAAIRTKPASEAPLATR